MYGSISFEMDAFQFVIILPEQIKTFAQCRTLAMDKRLILIYRQGLILSKCINYSPVAQPRIGRHLLKKKKLDYMYNNVEIDSNFVSRFYQECFQDTKNWDSGVQCCVGPTSNRLSTPSETFIHHLKQIVEPWRVVLQCFYCGQKPKTIHKKCEKKGKTNKQKELNWFTFKYDLKQLLMEGSKKNESLEALTPIPSSHAHFTYWDFPP